MLLVLMPIGCAHTHLRFRTVGQANTLNNIFEKQVLDNLAMFVVEPNSVPSFAYPLEGTTNVTDSLDITGTPFETFREALGIDFTRGGLEAWGLQPVVNPDKLHLMRCAYQRAVGFQCEDPCTECCKREKEFLGKPDKEVAVSKKNEDGSIEAVLDPRTNEPYIDPETGAFATYSDGFPVVDPATGLPKLYIKVPVYDCCGECSGMSQWFCHGRRSEVPKRCAAVGSYKGTYVWVTHENYGHLAKLVLQILDYASNDPPVTVPVQKEVQFYINIAGKPVKKDEAVGVVKAIVDVGVKNSTILAEKISLSDINSSGGRSALPTFTFPKSPSRPPYSPSFSPSTLQQLRRLDAIGGR